MANFNRVPPTAEQLETFAKMAEAGASLRKISSVLGKSHGWLVKIAKEANIQLKKAEPEAPKTYTRDRIRDLEGENPLGPGHWIAMEVLAKAQAIRFDP